MINGLTSAGLMEFLYHSLTVGGVTYFHWESKAFPSHLEPYTFNERVYVGVCEKETKKERVKEL